MRREYITYETDIPVNISLCKVKNYPIHWHNSIELIYVLKGNLSITIDTDTMNLKENDIEIVNIDEAHRLYSDEDNEVLIFHIDPYFFEKYYSDMKNMFFYTNTEEENSQLSDEYEDLRTFLSIILCEAVQKSDDYDEYLEKTLIDLLYHLINNFHYLMYEQEELRDKEEQLERYHRISKYIFNNYDSNITLQDIAKKEFLSTNYLSHEIKYATGYSFTDLLNLTRVEESVKLLLDTEMTLSEISEEIGFSHTRYFNKHFKLYFKMTPLQFRKKHKVDEETYEKQKQVEILPLKNALESVAYYIEDYDRYNFEDRITKLHINMSNNLGEFNKKFKEVINLGEAFDLLIEDNKDMLEELQYEVGFEYGRIENLFSMDMGIFPGGNFYNWSRARTVFEFLENISVTPLIVLDNKGFNEIEFINAFRNFVIYFSEIENLQFKSYGFQLSKRLPETLKEGIKEILVEKYDLKLFYEEYEENHNIDYIYDTAYMLPYIIHSVINNKNNLNYLKAYDVLDRQVKLTNEVFFGYPGMINDKGIKKPSYYAYFLLNKLGDTLVDINDGYVITKGENEYQILLYSYNEELNNLMKFEKFSKMRGVKNTVEKKYSLNIVNILKSSKMTFYEIDEDMGSSYNYWLSMGKPKRLNKEEEEIMLKASFPKIDFQYSKKNAVTNIRAELKGYGALLILIKEVL